MDNPILVAGHVYELRAPKTRQGTVSGYFDDPEKLYQAAQEFDGKIPGLYVTLNPVKPALLARAKNRLQVHAKTTTSDADILRRLWLLIDCDAVRPAEISSSDAEHHTALAQSETVAAWLSSQGWPGPVRDDSGNGGHLLYRIDLPNDAESTKLVKACLEVLALRFNDAAVVIDTGVYNAARITKLYGTKVCKGDSTEDRPHRCSQLLTIPESLVPVPTSLLQELARLHPADHKLVYQPSNGTRFDLQAFIRRYGLVVAREKPWNGHLVLELEVCPFNAEHRRDSSLIQFASGAIGFQCFHNSCHGRRWQDVRDLLAPGQSPRTPSSSEQASADFTLITADQIPIKPVKWIIHGRVPLAMLAGRGGLGKSTIGADWAAQVTTGKAAGALAGAPSHVIISSAEDTAAETLTPRLMAAKADLQKVHFIHLHRGGIDGSLTIPDDIDLLGKAIEQTQARLVIIDPLMAHLSATLNSWNHHEIRRALTPLARLAEELTVSILVIAHLNKDVTKAAIDRIGGSVGISNAARSVLFAGPDPDDPDGKVKMLAHPKCNVGLEQPTLRYRTESVTLPTGSETIETTRIVWEGEAPGITADDLVAKPEPVSGEARGLAVEWLEKALPVGMPRKETDIEAEAGKAGISRWVLKRVKPILQVKSKKEGFHPGVWWWWREATPNNTPSLHPSGEKPAKSLKNTKGAEGSNPALFVHSSTIEGSNISRSAPFLLPSNKSSTYDTSSLEGSRAGSYREEVDLRAD